MLDRRKVQEKVLTWSRIVEFFIGLGGGGDRQRHERDSGKFSTLLPTPRYGD
jgi:hypothetical protein